MIKNTISKYRSGRKHNDLVGIDFGTSATKVVRLKKSGESVSLTGVDILPPVDFSSSLIRLELPRSIAANYGCLTYTGGSSVMRMVNTPLQGDEETLAEGRLRELLSVGADFRTSAMLIKKGKGRQDSSFLAVAVPSYDVECMLSMFATGAPAPASLELSGLSFATAFLFSRGAECAEDTVCLIEVGESVSSYVFLSKGAVVLVGKMAFGSRTLSSRIAADLGVDEELAQSILNDRSINISSSLSSVLEPITKQISISKDFIERHQGCRITKVYVSGGMSMMDSFVEEMGHALHARAMTWSPFENINVESHGMPDSIQSQVTRFAAAIGAALGGFEDQ